MIKTRIGKTLRAFYATSGLTLRQTLLEVHFRDAGFLRDGTSDFRHQHALDVQRHDRLLHRASFSGFFSRVEGQTRSNKGGANKSSRRSLPPAFCFGLILTHRHFVVLALDRDAQLFPSSGTFALENYASPFRCSETA